MVAIEIGKELYLENVLSLRKQMRHNDINDEIMKIIRYLESNQINRTGSIITTTYDILGNNMLDIEILVPIDKVINLPLEYKMKPVFKITNAVYARHKGNPALLQGVYSEILEYIHNYGLQQITTAYNVTINEISLEGNVDELIIDVYIGVSNNIL